MGGGQLLSKATSSRRPLNNYVRAGMPCTSEVRETGHGDASIIDGARGTSMGFDFLCECRSKASSRWPSGADPSTCGRPALAAQHQRRPLSDRLTASTALLAADTMLVPAAYDSVEGYTAALSAFLTSELVTLLTVRPA